VEDTIITISIRMVRFRIPRDDARRRVHMYK
jgi:hypothetical protein